MKETICWAVVMRRYTHPDIGVTIGEAPLHLALCENPVDNRTPGEKYLVGFVAAVDYESATEQAIRVRAALIVNGEWPPPGRSR